MNKHEFRLLAMAFLSFILFRQLDMMFDCRGFEILWGLGMFIVVVLLMTICFCDVVDHIGKEDE